MYAAFAATLTTKQMGFFEQPAAMEDSITQISGNLTGLKASQIKAIERIYQRRMPPEKVITPELARYLTELSRELKKQLGVIINRKGAIVSVIVGSEREIVIPVLSDYPLGRKLLRGVRCVHTHLKNEPLTQDDLTDLAILRLDFMAAIGVKEDGLPANIYTAHILPYNPAGKTCEVGEPMPFHAFDIEMDGFASSLEEEMGRAITRDVTGTSERAILVSVSTKHK